jgi:FtsZ-binding cell division protein ZapB
VPDSVEKRVETPIQKFSRLRMELEELRSDLDSMTAEVTIHVLLDDSCRFRAISYFAVV